MIQLPYLLQFLSSSQGVMSPQSDNSPTLENALFKLPSLMKIDIVREYMELSHRDHEFTKFLFTVFRNILAISRQQIQVQEINVLMEEGNV